MPMPMVVTDIPIHQYQVQGVCMPMVLTDISIYQYQVQSVCMPMVVTDISIYQYQVQSNGLYCVKGLSSIMTKDISRHL
jgi:hypothetical protein